MKTATSPTKDVFLDRVAEGLADLTQEDREEVLQDLRTHLAEMDEEDIHENLGTPESFVSEFRASAGLDMPATGVRKWSLTMIRERLDQFGRRLGERTQWHTLRPVWIWIRGWVLVSSVAVLAEPTPFQRFPIPTINGQWIGLLLVIVATWLSLWLDRRRAPARDFTSVVFNTAAVLVVLISILAGRELTKTGPESFVDQTGFSEQLTGPGGNPIYNIYAYDVDGDPVEVLLFDQNGQPIRSMPDWVYDQADFGPGPHDFGEGLVTFPRDVFGRLITNLYPLGTFDYDGEALHPPSLGFPDLDEKSATDQVVTTTSLPGRLGG